MNNVIEGGNAAMSLQVEKLDNNMAFVVITGTPISFNGIYTDTKILNTIKFDYIKRKNNNL